jgi:hypothetical protein
MKERIEHSLRLVVVINMVVGKPQLGTVSNTVRWPRTTTIRATVAARITMALAARVELPANQAPVIMVMTQATIITRQRRPRWPRWPSQALTMTVPMRRTDLRQQAMSTQTGSTTSTNCTAYAVLSEALGSRYAAPGGVIQAIPAVDATVPLPTLPFQMLPRETCHFTQ